MGIEIPEYTQKICSRRGSTERSMVDLIEERYELRSDLLERAAKLKKEAGAWKSINRTRYEELMKRSRIMNGEASLLLKRSDSKTTLQEGIMLARSVLAADKKMGIL